MRVLAFVHGYLPHLPAGSETMLHEMLRTLEFSGHDVAVVSTDIRVPLSHMDKVENVPVHAMYPLDVADGFVADWAPDVIVSHHEHAQHAHALAHRLGARSVTLFHNDYRQAHAMLAQRPDLAVINSHWVTRRLAPSHLGVQSVIVHPPVDRERHRTTPGDAVTLVNLYRLKGPDVMYRLAHSNPDLKFLGVRGGYGAQVAHRGYPNVDIIDSTQDMAADVWSRTRVLIMPSRYESWGKVAVEAMASGIPVVANNTPGLTECLAAAGTLIPRLQPRAWHEAVRTLMTDDAAWEAASARALQRSEDIEQLRLNEMVAWVEAVEALA